MIKPGELESDKGRDIWDTIMAAAAGDMPTLQRTVRHAEVNWRRSVFCSGPLYLHCEAEFASALRPDTPR